MRYFYVTISSQHCDRIVTIKKIIVTKVRNKGAVFNTKCKSKSKKDYSTITIIATICSKSNS